MKIWMICLWIYSRNLKVLTPFKRTIHEVVFDGLIDQLGLVVSTPILSNFLRTVSLMTKYTRNTIYVTIYIICMLIFN